MGNYGQKIVIAEIMGREMFESFKELSEEELTKLYDMIRRFQENERDWQEFLNTLPKGNVLTLRFPETNAWHTWMLRDGYYTFKNKYGTRFARKIAREIINDQM